MPVYEIYRTMTSVVSKSITVEAENSAVANNKAREVADDKWELRNDNITDEININILDQEE